MGGELAAGKEALDQQPIPPSGIAVFIDDEPHLLRAEQRIADDAGFELREIAKPDRLDEKIDQIFSHAKELNLSAKKILFVIDNKMRPFSTSAKIEKIVSLNQVRMGKTGEHAGMTIAEWLVGTYGQTYAGFSVALVSSFSEEGISGRLTALQQQYPRFLGFLSKISADKDEGQREERSRHFRELIDGIKELDGEDRGGLSPIVDAAAYPYGKVLALIVKEIDLSPDEVKSFLGLTDASAHKIKRLEHGADHFELDSTDWQQKVITVMDLLIMLEYDFGTMEKVKLWLNSPHILLDGHSPRQEIVSGSLLKMDSLRSLVRY